MSNDIYRKTKILQKQANRKKNANRLKITKTQNALAQSLVCVQHYHLVASWTVAVNEVEATKPKIVMC